MCISKRLGGGATCSIFRVRRFPSEEKDAKYLEQHGTERTPKDNPIVTEKIMIGKMIRPENETVKQMIYDEVGVLMTNAGQNSIINCYDTLLYNGMYWMFLEHMDGDIL